MGDHVTDVVLIQAIQAWTMPPRKLTWSTPALTAVDSNSLSTSNSNLNSCQVFRVLLCKTDTRSKWDLTASRTIPMANPRTESPRSQLLTAVTMKNQSQLTTSHQSQLLMAVTMRNQSPLTTSQHRLLTSPC